MGAVLDRILCSFMKLEPNGKMKVTANIIVSRKIIQFYSGQCTDMEQIFCFEIFYFYYLKKVKIQNYKIFQNDMEQIFIKKCPILKGSLIIINAYWQIYCRNDHFF